MHRSVIILAIIVRWVLFINKAASQAVADKYCAEYYPEFKINLLGGEKTQKGEYPFMAAIGFEGETQQYDYRCGGFLVAPDFVVTAAHCTSFRGKPAIVVCTGGVSLNENNTIPPINISAVVPHPLYNKKNAYHDIAILRLSEKSLHTPACLWTSPTIIHQQGIALGYGNTQFEGRRSNDLLKVRLNLFDNTFCSRFYQPGYKIAGGISRTQICAGDLVDPKDTCQGDSGGPILVVVERFNEIVPLIIGVTSFGQGCAGGVPSIYTRMSSYVYWIEQIVWPDG